MLVVMNGQQQTHVTMRLEYVRAQNIDTTQHNWEALLDLSKRDKIFTLTFDDVYISTPIW